MMAFGAFFLKVSRWRSLPRLMVYSRVTSVAFLEESVGAISAAPYGDKEGDAGARERTRAGVQVPGLCERNFGLSRQELKRGCAARVLPLPRKVSARAPRRPARARELRCPWLPSACPSTHWRDCTDAILRFVLFSRRIALKVIRPLKNEGRFRVSPCAWSSIMSPHTGGCF